MKVILVQSSNPISIVSFHLKSCRVLFTILLFLIFTATAFLFKAVFLDSKEKQLHKFYESKNTGSHEEPQNSSDVSE